MTRLKQAWLALTGRLEPERVEVVREVQVEVPVYGEMVEVDLYEARSPRYSFFRRHGGIPIDIPDWHGRVFLSCEQAFKECPGAEVVTKKYWRIGRKHYEAPNLAPVTVQPKPKVAKGRGE